MNNAKDQKTKTIYMIDDNPDFSKSLSDYFSDSGYEVTIISDEMLGIELIKKVKPDAVFLDLGLRKLSGLEVLKIIKGIYEFLPVIIISGTEILTEAVEAVKQGADDFISKPVFDLSAVELRLQRAFEKNQLKLELKEHKINLEKLVLRRTKELNEKKEELEKTNVSLTEEIERRRNAEEYIKQASLNIIDAREEERRKLAFELHDSVIQKLTFTKISLELFQRLGAEGKNHFGKAMKSIDEMADEIRMIIRSLYPQSIDKYPLTHNLATLIKQIEDISEIKFICKISGEDKVADPKVKLNVYRVFQEIFNNITKHSKAKNVNIEINISDGRLSALVSDDGIGYDAEEKLKNKKGAGLFSMSERIIQLGGNIKFSSRKDIGSEVSIQIPVEGL